MDVRAASALLGGLSPAAFMRRHWQKRPLLVRQALPGVQPPVSRSELFALAARDDVESRLVVRQGAGWQLRHGPLPRRALPALSRRGWTLLVQGLDLHVQAAHELLRAFRFVPDARLDDLMISWAADGGGVGPHLDAYDVFLVQVQGRRRWRWGRVDDPAWRAGVPLKILQRFEPEFDAVLDRGDLLYLPPGWGHDGTAVGECMTCSVGFRSPAAHELAAEIVQRLGDGDAPAGERRYRDPRQPASAAPGAIPPELFAFARQAVQKLVADPQQLARSLGEWLTEPKAQVWFDGAARSRRGGRARGGVVLDRRTRMMYDTRHLFINGEAFRIGGRDARALRRLADERALDEAACRALSADAAAALQSWCQSGWARVVEE